MKRRMPRMALLLILTATAGLWLCGCESGDSGTPAGEFRISPSEHRFSSNSHNLTLTVIGGHPPFTWRVANPELGRLTAGPGEVSEGGARVVTYSDNVIYTRTDAETEAINIVSVADKRTWTASCRIFMPQQPDPDWEALRDLLEDLIGE